MKNNLSLLLCSTAALLTCGTSGQAATFAQDSRPNLHVQSYAELLEPIPNAVAMLKADDAARMSERPFVQLAQYHHHHHHFYHHHHHHHHGYYSDGPAAGIIGGIIGGMVARPRYAPDCYWTQGRPYWDGYSWVRRRVQVCE